MNMFRLIMANWLVFTGLGAAVTLLAPSLVIVVAITVIGIPIAIALAWAPFVFIVSLGSVLLHRVLNVGVMGYVIGAGATVLVLMVPPYFINAGLSQRASQLIARDRDTLSRPLQAVTIAIRDDRPGRFGRDDARCDGLCMRMLLNGVAKRVLRVEQKVDEPLNAATAAVSFRLEARRLCPAVKLQTGGDEIGADGEQRSHVLKQAHELMQIEIAKGNCLIEETVPLGTADVVISRGSVNRGKSPITAGLDPFADTLDASRFGVHVRGDGGFKEAYRRTGVLLFPLAPVLAPTVYGGAQLRGYAVLARSASRLNIDWDYKSEREWSLFLTKTLGLDLAWRDSTAVDDTRQILTAAVSIRGAVHDAATHVGRDFIDGIARTQKMDAEDHRLAREILTDPRFSLSSSAWAAIRYAGAADDDYFDSIAASMFQRLSVIAAADDVTRYPAWREEAGHIAKVVRELPATAIRKHRSELEWLARQERLRVWAAPSLTRLHEFGAEAAPLLLHLMDEAVRLRETYGSDWNGPYLAGLIGLCRMGEAGRGMIRALYARIDAKIMVTYGSYRDLTIETLVGLGAKPDEIWLHMQTEDKNHSRRRFDRVVARALRERRCIY